MENEQNLVEVSKGNNRPESFDKYNLKYPHPMLDRDEEILQRLFDAGFTNEQAQLVYDLANERVIPYLDDLTVNFEAEKQLEKLVKYFGSKEKFQEISRQISVWAKKEVSPEAYDALGSTSEGVIALYKMMSSNEPMIGKENGSTEELNEESLKKMMEDPKYWREKDNGYIQKVSKGFERLYNK